MNIFEKAAESLKNPPPRFMQPQATHKFRVLPLGIGQEYTEHFCHQTQNVKFNMVAKTVTLDVCQTVFQETFDMMSVFLTDCQTVVVDFMGGREVNFSVVIRITDRKHEMVLGYGEDTSLMHRITLHYENLETIKGDQKERTPLQMVETGTEEFLTPEQALELVLNTKKVEEPASKPVKKTNVERKANRG